MLNNINDQYNLCNHPTQYDDEITNVVPTNMNDTALVTFVSDDKIYNEVQSIVKPSLKEYLDAVITISKKDNAVKLKEVFSARTSLRLKNCTHIYYKKLSSPTVWHVLLQHINNNIVNKKLINFNPTVSKFLIQQIVKPLIPIHVDQGLKNNIRTDWIDCIYTVYDKLHNTSIWSYLLPRSSIPGDSKVVPPRLSFDGKITNVDCSTNLKVDFVMMDQE